MPAPTLVRLGLSPSSCQPDIGAPTFSPWQTTSHISCSEATSDWSMASQRRASRFRPLRPSRRSSHPGILGESFGGIHCLCSQRPAMTSPEPRYRSSREADVAAFRHSCRKGAPQRWIELSGARARQAAWCQVRTWGRSCGDGERGSSWRRQTGQLSRKSSEPDARSL